MNEAYIKPDGTLIELSTIPLPAEPAPEIVRVLRIVEYVGPRAGVEQEVAMALHGTKHIGKTGIMIRATTLGEYPERVAVTAVTP